MTGVINTDANGVVQTDTNGVIQTVTSATAQFDVAIASTTSPVAPGDELGVTADVSNSGGAQGTQTITLDINNGVGQVDSASVTLSAGGSTTQALSWVVPSGQTEQDYTATVASADDTASQTVTVGSGTATLPSSARNRWQIGSNTGSTVNDSVGTADGSINGATRTSDANAQNSEVLSFDGTDDYLGLTKLGSFGSSLTTDFTVALTVETTTTPSGGTLIGGQSSSDGSGGTAGDATTIRTRVIDDSTIRFNLTDQGKNTISVETSSLDSPVSDGNKHRYLFVKATNNASGMSVYQDATAQTKTTVGDQAFSNTIDFDLNPVQIGRMQFNGGFDTQYLDATVDDIVIYSSALSSSERQDDYDIQPWS